MMMMEPVHSKKFRSWAEKSGLKQKVMVVTNKGSVEQPACPGEWKKRKEEHELCASLWVGFAMSS